MSTRTTIERFVLWTSGQLPAPVLEAVLKQMSLRGARDLQLETFARGAKIGGSGSLEMLKEYKRQFEAKLWLPENYDDFIIGPDPTGWGELVVSQQHGDDAWGAVLGWLAKNRLNLTDLSEHLTARGNLIGVAEFVGDARVIREIKHDIMQDLWFPNLEPRLRKYSTPVPEDRRALPQFELRVDGTGSRPGLIAGLRQIIQDEGVVTYSNLAHAAMSEEDGKWGGLIRVIARPGYTRDDIERRARIWADGHEAALKIAEYQTVN